MGQNSCSEAGRGKEKRKFRGESSCFWFTSKTKHFFLETARGKNAWRGFMEHPWRGFMEYPTLKAQCLLCKTISRVRISSFPWLKTKPAKNSYRKDFFLLCSFSWQLSPHKHIPGEGQGGFVSRFSSFFLLPG